MKKMNFWLLASLMVGALTFVACHDDNNSAPGNGSDQPAAPIDPTTMKAAALSGFVHAKGGTPLAGVKVSTGSESTITDIDGGFTFKTVGTKATRSGATRTVLTFSKSGYFDVTRSAEYKDGDVWEIQMMSKSEGKEATLVAANGGNITKDGMDVGFQTNAFKDGNGNILSGNVKVEMAYLNPDDADFAESIPGGDLAAIDKDGNPVQLVSGGMTLVNMSASGAENVNLVNGRPATMKYPVTDYIKEKFGEPLPQKIPLWSLDENGVWQQEEEATLDDSKQFYIGPAKHFSWVNLDYPSYRVTLNLIVKDSEGNPVPFLKVDVDGQRIVFTDNNGKASLYIPKDMAVYVCVHPEDYSNASEVKETISAMSSDGTYTLVLPRLSHISGKVTNSNSEGSNIATVWIEYSENDKSTKTTKKIHTDVDGKFYLNAPANYQGPAQLKARGTDGTVTSVDITLNGTDQAFNININSGAPTGGTANFIVDADGTAYSYSIIPSGEDLSGVCAVGKVLSLSDGYSNESGSSSWYIVIHNYNAGTTTFNNQYFTYNYYANGEQVSGYTNEKNEIKVTQSGNTYRFQVAGSGFLHDYAKYSWNNQPATVTADFTAPLLLKGNVLNDVTSKKNSFPSFTPWLGKTAEMGVEITESPKMSKGVVLHYGDHALTISDFENLVAQAKSVLGEPINYYNSKDDNNDEGGSENVKRKVEGDGDDWYNGDYGQAYFFKDGNFVMVAYCGWRDGIEFSEEEEFNLYRALSPESSRLQVVALENINFNYEQFTEWGHHRRVKGERNWEPAWKAYRK